MFLCCKYCLFIEGGVEMAPDHNMTDNFRSYMDHLSHLSPDQDSRSSPWQRPSNGNNAVDMCSSDESVDENSPTAQTVTEGT